MRKKISDEFATKAKKREIKKRPRMKLHGVSLKKMVHAGKKLISR
jgi:hypothetical protein